LSSEYTVIDPVNRSEPKMFSAKGEDRQRRSDAHQCVAERAPFLRKVTETPLVVPVRPEPIHHAAKEAGDADHDQQMPGAQHHTARRGLAGLIDGQGLGLRQRHRAQCQAVLNRVQDPAHVLLPVSLRRCRPCGKDKGKVLLHIKLST
jgi:hypothetical protein